MDSFRDQLTFSIGFAIQQNRALMRRILTEHVADDARQMLAAKVIAHLELCGFEIDEQERLMRKRDGGRGWQWAASVSRRRGASAPPVPVAASVLRR